MNVVNLAAWLLAMLFSLGALASDANREAESFWRQHVSSGAFEGANGLRLHYAAFIRHQASAAVVIVNGRTETYLKNMEVTFELARAGYSVYLYDHRGQGLSSRLLSDAQDHDKGHVQRFDDYVDDLQLFIDRVVLRVHIARSSCSPTPWAVESRSGIRSATRACLLPRRYRRRCLHPTPIADCSEQPAGRARPAMQACFHSRMRRRSRCPIRKPIHLNGRPW